MCPPPPPPALCLDGGTPCSFLVAKLVNTFANCIYLQQADLLKDLESLKSTPRIESLNSNISKTQGHGAKLKGALDKVPQGGPPSALVKFFGHGGTITVCRCVGMQPSFVPINDVPHTPSVSHQFPCFRHAKCIYKVSIFQLHANGKLRSVVCAKVAKASTHSRAPYTSFSALMPTSKQACS